MGQHRRVVSDEAWAWMEPLLPSSAGYARIAAALAPTVLAAARDRRDRRAA